jgi:hypothetical protein
MNTERPEQTQEGENQSDYKAMYEDLVTRCELYSEYLSRKIEIVQNARNALKHQLYKEEAKQPLFRLYDTQEAIFRAEIEDFWEFFQPNQKGEQK